ncbi:MAG: acyl carrier protein [Candidatus Omnitrophica bacterium]|nr:acyl carrier protein [Candidatus Omnitrophota bacterium]
MISERMKKVILRALRLKEFDLRDETRAYEVPGWDSLNHVVVLAAIEKEYNLRFRSHEVLPLSNIGDLQALVDRKMADAR